MIRQLSGIVIDCDGCHDECWNELVPFWESEADARDYLGDTGWVFTGFGQALCPACQERRRCAETGHEFLPPDSCKCGGRLPAHWDGCRDWQLCARCGHTEETD